jgi:hypothetical protein
MTPVAPFIIETIRATITAAPTGYFTFGTMPNYTAIVMTPDGSFSNVPVGRPMSGPFWDADPATLLLKPLPVGARIRGIRIRASGVATPGQFEFDYIEAPKMRTC